MDSRKSILVIHPGALGDVVLSFSAMERLAARFDAVHLLCQEQIGTAAEKMNVVARAFPLESARFAGLYGGFSADLKKWLGTYTAVLVLSVSSELAGRIRKNFRGTVLAIPPRPAAGVRLHTAAHLLRHLSRSGWIDPGMKSAFRDLRSRQADPRLVLIHPGAGSRRKRWPLARFLALAGRITEAGLTPFFFIGPAEIDLKETIRSRRWPLFFTDRLCELVERLGSAGALVGNDSGVSHLAAYIGLPTIAVFGPTDPRRWAPRGKKVAVVAPEWRLDARFGGNLEAVTRASFFESIGVERVLGALKDLV